MANLDAARRGYAYQDLLVACRLVDVLLGTVVEVSVDEKLVPADRFDDLTTLGAAGSRERIQIKHTDNVGRALSLATFTRDDRRLRLDRVVASVLADRDGPGASASAHSYRIVLRDGVPADSRLASVLVAALVDPGPFVPGMRSARLAFNADALWSQMQAAGEAGHADYPFAFMAGGSAPLSRADLDWVCGRLVVEVQSPASSGDLTDPAEAEALLLRRVREDVGAGMFPNVGRSAVDVAAAIIDVAQSAREGRLEVTASDILQRAQLRCDFGAVSCSHPVDRSLEVTRNTAVRSLADLAAETAESGGAVLVTGPPGQGKSWLCQQVLEGLGDSGWLTAEHYCYLGAADHERTERVLADTVFGSLINRIEQADERPVGYLRPRFASDEDALIECVARSVELEPDRKVAIVVDGIDHVTRVQRRHDGSDPSLRLAKRLAALAMPPNSVLIVLSQPGPHLGPLEESGAQTVRVGGLDRAETEMLAARLHLIPPPGDAGGAEAPLVQDAEEAAEMVDALVARSGGNALYATYLCREAIRRNITVAAPAAVVLDLPPFDEMLQGYYDHLRKPLDDEGAQVADIVALLDFAVSRDELRSMLPDAAHRVDGALDMLAPVLSERAAGGIRVYHESFARHLCGAFQHDDAARCALVTRVTDWLKSLGFFADARAFRHLIPLLGDAGSDREAADIVESDFVARSVAAGFTTSEIIGNLAAAAGCAARVGDWPVVIRCVELSRAALTYQTETLDPLLADHVDVLIAVLGPDVLAERLVHDDRPAMQISTGLRMCAAVDAAGAVAPWRHYLEVYCPSGSEDPEYSGGSSLEAEVAWLRGWLRLAAPAEEPAPSAGHALDDLGRTPDGENGPILDPAHLGAPIEWHRVARFVEEQRLPAWGVVEPAYDTHGASGLVRLVDLLGRPAEMCLAVAELVATDETVSDLGDARSWALEAVEGGIPPGALHAALSLGVGLPEAPRFPAQGSLERLCGLAREVQEEAIRWESEPLDAWLDECTAAAQQDPLALNAAEALIEGRGWYRCWLRFTIGLARAEAAATEDREPLAMEALSQLESDLDPFSGRPRSCDLYEIRHTIQDTIWRAVELTDEQWTEAIRLVSRVSNALTVTLQGSIGGPVPPAFVLGLAVAGVTADTTHRRALAAELLQAETSQYSATRHYPDLAEYRLLEARLAAAAGDTDEAHRQWHEACRLITAYGRRKDITIYELLDPLEMLIKADRVRGRTCLASAQPLCERVLRHTDGKETSHAPQHWWGLLAQADPAALARLAAPQLLRDCNLPNPDLHQALTDMWRSWHTRADPLLAGALRLTLDTPVGPGDVEELELLADSAPAGGAENGLMAWMLARADERPASYTYPEVSNIDARDRELVAGLNSVAEANGLPPVTPVSGALARPTAPSRSPSDDLTPDHGPSIEDLPLMPDGEAGLAKAISAWRARPYRPDGTCWDIAEFAKEISERVTGLGEAGRFPDGVHYLRLLADASWSDEGARLLQEVAGCLDQRGDQSPLADVAHTLAWTRAAGSHGYNGFGGETGISSLHRASDLDPALALEIVAAETESVIAAGKYGTYGFAKTLIHAFGVGALVPADASPLDTAFAALDEVRSVIDYRTPRVHDSDDPTDSYTPDGDASDISRAELDEAFALGILGELGDASREKKRRTLLAVRVLLTQRPTQAAAAVDLALSELSDPATLTWLLRLIDTMGTTVAPVISACRQTLLQLARRDHLVVRALARRLLGDAAASSPPAADDKALLTAGGTRIWTPANHDDDVHDEHLSRAAEMVRVVAGHRLFDAEEMLPGLCIAVVSRVADAIATNDYHDRLRPQLTHYSHPDEHHWPDAYLYGEQTVEDALQRVACAGRTARARMGLASDPCAWEDRLADMLLDDPRIPLTLETRRVPRPAIPAPPQPDADRWSGDVTATTLGVESADTAWPETLITVRGWPLIATVELQRFQHPDRLGWRELAVMRYRVPELHGTGDGSRIEWHPAEGDIRLWMEDVDDSAAAHPLIAARPLFGLDLTVEHAGDGRAGLGAPTHLLTPTDALVATLGLRPAEPFKLNDSHGGGMALITWRTSYNEGTFSMPRPRLIGSGVTAHPDLIRRLIAATGERLAIRDFIVEIPPTIVDEAD